MDCSPTTRLHLFHRAFRREFGLLPGVVAAVGHADVRRATAVSDHIMVLLRLLQDHHGGERRLVWPWLRERIPSPQFRWIDVQEQQHRVADVLMDALVSELGGWAGRADGRTQTQVVRHLHQGNALLTEYLEHRETRMFPLMRAHLRAVEWDRLLTAARSTPPASTFHPWMIRMGAVLEGASGAEAAWYRAGQSGPARMWWLLAGRAAYARHARRIRGSLIPVAL